MGVSPPLSLAQTRNHLSCKGGGYHPKASRLTPVAVATATASATSATAATSTITAATAARRAFLPRPGLIDRQGAALEVLLMEHRDGFIGIFLRAHLDKRKPARAARRAILHDVYCNNSP